MPRSSILGNQLQYIPTLRALLEVEHATQDKRCDRSKQHVSGGGVKHGECVKRSERGEFVGREPGKSEQSCMLLCWHLRMPAPGRRRQAGRQAGTGLREGANERLVGNVLSVVDIVLNVL